MKIGNDEDLNACFRQAYRILEGMGRLKVKSVFEIFALYPESIQLACRIVSSMPTTQVTEERLFSALKTILSERRQSMKNDLYRVNIQ